MEELQKSHRRATEELNKCAQEVFTQSPASARARIAQPEDAAKAKNPSELEAK
jgi:hypothetical protein